LLGFAHILRDFGVGNYLIQAKIITTKNLRAAYSVMLYSSWLIAVFLYLIRYLIADFYNQNGIAEVIGLIAINFLIVPFGAPILTLLRREMKFEKVAIVSIGNATVQVFVTLLCAYHGLSYLSMAWGSIAGMIANVLLLLVLRPSDMNFIPTLTGLSEVLNFGYKSIVVAFASESGVAAPDIILGRTLGFATVAYYSRASGLIQMAIGQVIKIVYDVFLPAFARDLRNGEDPAGMYCHAMSLMLSILAPLIAFIMVMSGPLIIFLFGDQWASAIPIASILSLYALFSCPFLLAGSALMAAGHISVVMRLQLVIQAITIFIFLSSIWLPLEKVVMMQFISTGVSLILHAKALNIHFGLKISVLWKSVRHSYLLVPLAIFPIVLLRLLDIKLNLQFSLLMQLVLSAALFIFSWMVAINYTNHPIKSELHKFFASIGLRSM